jgi:hypothetical protein
MSRVFFTEKQPDEQIVCTIDFSLALGADETITAVDSTGYNEAGESSCWSTMSGGVSVGDDSRSISVGILGGDDGCQYHIELFCTLNSLLPDATSYALLEADLYVTVRDL